MQERIYLDNNATTQPLPEVVEAMMPFLREGYANPSSVHQFGQSARHAVECARAQVAGLIGASPKEIVFTSGGTESINLAIRGMLKMNTGKRHLVTTAVEHSAVLSVAREVASEGYEVDYLGVDSNGIIDEEAFTQRIGEHTGLVSLLHVNNETGVINDVARLASIAADRGVPVHVDAVQTAGKLPLDVSDWPVQLISLAAHKFHGPKGVGALYVRHRTRPAPLITGGGHERQLRGGTENVPGIVGMGVASEVAQRDLSQRRRYVTSLRDTFEAGVLKAIPYAHVNGAAAWRVGNTSNISFEGLQAEAVLILLSEAGICASAGSACSSGSLDPSHVLQAMNVEERFAHGAIRFSLSHLNTQGEIDRVLKVLPGLLQRLTALNAPSS
ncbi:MAG: cysteine desulfurase [Phycisphaerales bacterium]|nr:MAG: cysteine desulfurase [Phycisphaerales bacterium]